MPFPVCLPRFGLRPCPGSLVLEMDSSEMGEVSGRASAMVRSGQYPFSLAARAAAEEQRRAGQLAEQAKAGGPGAIATAIVAYEATQTAEQARKAVAAMPQRAQVRPFRPSSTTTLSTSRSPTERAQSSRTIEWRAQQCARDQNTPIVRVIIANGGRLSMRGQ